MKKMYSSPPEASLLFLCTKSELFTFSICNIQLSNRYGLHSFMQSLMLECGCCLVLLLVLAHRAAVQVSLCYAPCVSSLYALSIELINLVNSLF